MHGVRLCVGSVSFGAAYLLIKISISLFSLSVCVSFSSLLRWWLAGWLAGWFVSLWGFCLLMMSDGVTVSWLSLFFSLV